jgi:hypothetical protein
MAAIDERAVTHTYWNCTWAERQMTPGVPLWLNHVRWCCLVLSQRAERRVAVQPDRCATCPDWQARAELLIHTVDDN